MRQGHVFLLRTFSIKGSAALTTLLVVLMLSGTVGGGTAGAAPGDIVLVTTGCGEAQASSMTPDGRYVAMQAQLSISSLGTSSYQQILLKDVASGQFTLVSTVAGIPADDDCGHPSITPDGRYVAFHSDATNLGGTGAYGQIFRKDLLTGAIVLVSCDAGGVEGDDESRRPRMSADGRYVAFESYATNLGGTGSERQVFVKDLTSGTVVLASSDGAWVEADAETGHPFITPDGRYVAFHSPAGNLVPAATGVETQVFRKDLTTGAIVLVSSTAGGIEANDKSKYPYITPDGRYVSFYSEASNLDAAASGSYFQVFQKDLTTNAVTLVSKSSGGVEGDDACAEWGASFMSDDAQYVCFITSASNLDPAAPGDSRQVFRKDLASGAVTLVSKNSGGAEAEEGAWRASMTPDGRYAVFYSESANLVGGAMPVLGDQVFRKDIATGEVLLVSYSEPSLGGNSDSQAHDMTPDGRYIAFQSWATSLAPGATNGQGQILRKDMATGDYLVASSTPGGVQADDDCFHPSITPDGRYVAFHSGAGNLGATGTYWQVFRKDLATGALLLVSTTPGGQEGDETSYRPVISADGRFVAFDSYAANLGGTGTHHQIFVKDLATGAVVLASSNSAWVEGDAEAGQPCVTPDGRYVSFHSPSSNLAPGATGGDTQVFRKDLATGAIVLASCNSGGTEADGKSRLSWLTPDGRYVTFMSDATNLLAPATSGTYQAYRKDLNTGEVRMASCSASGTEGNAALSDKGQIPISADGTYVAFGSYATNLGPTTSGADEQTFRKNLDTGQVALASCDASGDEADDWSWRNCMTLDGRFVTFYSPATNLAPGAEDGDDQIYRKELPAPAISNVIKSVASDNPAPGGVLTYTINITNGGQERALGVTVTDAIPDGTSVVPGSVTCSAAGASVDSEDPVKVSNITVEVGATVTVTFKVTIDADIQPGVVIENQALVGYASAQIASSPPSDPGSGKPTEITVGGTKGSTAWIVAEGSTGAGFETFILLQNPNSVPAPTAIGFATENGIQTGTTLTIPANSRTTLRLSDYLPDTWSISTLVASEVPVVVERSMYWDKRVTRYPYEMMGGHANLGLPALMSTSFEMYASPQRSTSQFFPEGSTAGFDTWILLFNPNQAAAQATVTLMDAGGPVVNEQVTIEPLSRKTVHLNKLLPDANEVATRVESASFLVVERSMYWDPAASAKQPCEMIGGHATSGSPGAAKSWYVAEGATAGGFETFVLLQNPTKSAANVSLGFMGTSGIARQAAVTMPPESRSTVKVSDFVPDNFQVSTSVTSDVDIVVERSMYWDKRVTREPWAMKEGHSCIGEVGTGKTWVVPEGSTGGGFDTFVLITNTENGEAAVSVTFMTETGPKAPVALTIPANSRYTLRISDHLPGSFQVSTMISGSKELVVESSMYWDMRATSSEGNFPARPYECIGGSSANGLDP